MQNLNDIVKPLHELTKKDVKFTWTSEHNQAFNVNKQLLTSYTVWNIFTNKKRLN